MQKLCLPLVTRDSMDCYYRCLTILSMFPITFINLKTPRLCLWRRRSWGCGCSVNRACKYLTKNLCLQPLITGSVNIRDPNRQKNLKSTICNWSDHAILEKKFTIWKPLRRKNAASDTSSEHSFNNTQLHSMQLCVVVARPDRRRRRTVLRMIKGPGPKISVSHSDGNGLWFN